MQISYATECNIRKCDLDEKWWIFDSDTMANKHNLIQI